MMNKKILFLTRSLNYGGAERQLVALAKGLHKGGYAVSVAVFYPNGALEKDLYEVQSPVICLNKSGRWDVFPFLLRLIRVVRREKPDILHGYLPVPNLLTVLLKPLLPNILMVWGVRASNVDSSQYDYFTRLVFMAERFFSRFADLIIVNSHAGKTYHIEHGFPESKMVVIPNGIDTERFCPNPDTRLKVRSEWGINNNEKLIGLVGRIDPMKDHATFLRAAAMLLKERGDVRFVCIGDGPEPYKSRMKQLSIELGLKDKLVWAGARSDMSDVYNALDIASSSSSYGEGFPNVVGEAMACGVPCVVTDVGDSAWIVGDTGVVVPPHNPQALAAGLESSLQRGNKLMAVRTRKRIEEKFSFEQLIEKTQKTLLHLIG